MKPTDSNGCVALENKNIIALSDFIHLDATPLIIVEQIDSTSLVNGNFLFVRELSRPLL
ncbi:L,D-transpeptidase [Desulfobacter hydrogenophilus]|uniref:L,D-transpeptidase n=1 Tax=Desulfobacter hydrogenophilus TaxID=2291 RepID=UPI001F5E926D|nr:L,D-transpeptidase [Desulfobacter hydrogenophilus]